MRYLVTGSSGHLGEALVRTLRKSGADVRSVDLKAGAYTDHVGSISDPAFVETHCQNINVILHAATLHKPHVATHTRQDFVDTNITGTLNLLEAARKEKVGAFVFTSTTSLYGEALTPASGAPAAWITEKTLPRSRNIYGVTKLAAEDLCWLFYRNEGLPVIILRTSRFFPEMQDSKDMRAQFSTENAQVLEFLHRRVDLEDVVSAHLIASERARELGFGRYIISATTPFKEDDRADLRKDAGRVVRQYVDFEETFSEKKWSMYEAVDRVYINQLAREELGWEPEHSFKTVLERVKNGGSALSSFAREIGIKMYHDERFESEPYPVTEAE